MNICQGEFPLEKCKIPVLEPKTRPVYTKLHPVGYPEFQNPESGSRIMGAPKVGSHDVGRHEILRSSFPQ